MLTFGILVIAVAALLHAYYSRQSARALMEQSRALTAAMERVVETVKPNAQLAPQRRLIAINRFKIDDDTWEVMADADDGTVWTYEDDHGWLLGRQRRSIPQLPVEPTLQVKA